MVAAGERIIETLFFESLRSARRSGISFGPWNFDINGKSHGKKSIKIDKNLVKMNNCSCKMIKTLVKYSHGCFAGKRGVEFFCA